MYLVDDILIHKESKQLIKVLDVFKDFDYYEYYTYEVMDLETELIDRRQQGHLECMYMSSKDINNEITRYEKEMSQLVDKISDLKWLRGTIVEKLKYIENKKEIKR